MDEKSLFHIAKFDPDDILERRVSIRKKHRNKKTFNVDGTKYNVKMTSPRYHLFAASKTCICCGIEGNEMWLDGIKREDGKVDVHFNLYCRLPNGKLILFTKDHIHPRSKGGSNDLSNYQTMCTFCNRLKSNHEISVDELKEFPRVKQWVAVLSKMYEIIENEAA